MGDFTRKPHRVADAAQYPGLRLEPRDPSRAWPILDPRLPFLAGRVGCRPTLRAGSCDDGCTNRAENCGSGAHLPPAPAWPGKVECTRWRTPPGAAARRRPVAI